MIFKIIVIIILCAIYAELHILNEELIRTKWQIYEQVKRINPKKTKENKE